MLSATTKTQTAVRGALAIIGFGIGWIDHNLTPLFWALIIMIALDLLLNTHDEAVMVQKLIKSVMAALIPVVLDLLGKHTVDPYIYLQAGISVALAVELSSVAPLLMARINQMIPAKTRQAADVIMESELKKLQAENAALKTQVTQGGTKSGNPTTPGS